MEPEIHLKKEPGAKLKIHCEGLAGYSSRVWLDGHEISHCLRALKLEIGIESANIVTLELLVNDLECTAETLATIQAYLQAKAEREP